MRRDSPRQTARISLPSGEVLLSSIISPSENGRRYLPRTRVTALMALVAFDQPA